VQVLAVVGDLIQPLIVVDLVDVGATTERVRVLGRIVVHEQVVAPPARVTIPTTSAARVASSSLALLMPYLLLVGSYGHGPQPRALYASSSVVLSMQRNLSCNNTIMGFL
jgi:hypothetical protein